MAKHRQKMKKAHTITRNMC